MGCHRRDCGRTIRRQPDDISRLPARNDDFTRSAFHPMELKDRQGHHKGISDSLIAAQSDDAQDVLLLARRPLPQLIRKIAFRYTEVSIAISDCVSRRQYE